MHLPVGYSETIRTPHTNRQIEAEWSYVADHHGSSTILPDGRCDVILQFHKSKPDQVTPIITGPATYAYQVKYADDDSWVGIRLKPGNGHVVWGYKLAKARNKVLRGDAAIALLPALANVIVAKDLGTLLPKTDLIPDQVQRTLNAIHMSGGQLRMGALAAFATVVYAVCRSWG